ncbi:hypothetical protein [Salinactinospora qingdaonensis]|uniref:DUF418 domain-containing protein n=1 Tax=Salinactinospora qingdaonensis TaxID=702744 RepID=A0ABP7G234_9ACTN
MLYLGLLAGAALGTTAWSHLAAVFWYQLWWSVPRAAGLTLVIRDNRRVRPASHPP